MKLDININTDQNCSVLIEDLSTYLDKTLKSVNPNMLKFLDTVSIISIVHSDTREDKLKYSYVKKHTGKNFFKVPINFDGVFTVKYIVMPTKEWYDRLLKSVSKNELIDAFKGRIYIYDGKQIIEITKELETEVSVSDFINSEYSDNLSVSSYDKLLLSICKLKKCYVNLCLQIFDNKNFSPCWSKNKIDSELIYKRDLVWMAINIITYMWHQDLNIYEIDRILKLINKYNGLCSPYPNDNSKGKTNGCGCSS